MLKKNNDKENLARAVFLLMTVHSSRVGLDLLSPPRSMTQPRVFPLPLFIMSQNTSGSFRLRKSPKKFQLLSAPPSSVQQLSHKRRWVH